MIKSIKAKRMTDFFLQHTITSGDVVDSVR